MDFRERLEKIENLKSKIRQITGNHQKKSIDYSKSRGKATITEIVPGNVIDTPHGSCFFAEHTIPLDTSYGNTSLLDMQKVFPAGLHIWLPQLKRENNDLNWMKYYF